MSQPAPAQCHAIPYLEDSAAYYLRFRGWPYPIWLDSGRPHAEFGRYDIISAAPNKVLQTTDQHTSILHGDRKTTSSTPALRLLAEELTLFTIEHSTDMPFAGGAMGYLGYNLASQLEPRVPYPAKDVALPDMVMGIYHWAIVQDHHTRSSYVVTTPSLSGAELEEILTLATNPSTTKGTTETTLSISELTHQLDKASYLKQLETIKNYIAAGDCYQVNFAQRFDAAYTGDPFLLFQEIRRQLPAPYACFMETPEGAILCHSPERFLSLQGRHVETKPIKGTAPRAKDPRIDEENAKNLLESSKDRAENVMIVDLLRNDLSKTCEANSVVTPRIGELESYANVHHLVSTVTGKLREEESAVSLLAGCFPGGSITGAPKLRAMEIIAELEQVERSVYCGSLGYISFNGNMDLNITIRTLACDKEKIYCWGGGGIVMDSIPEAEYQESLDKVSPLLAAMRRFTT